LYQSIHSLENPGFEGIVEQGRKEHFKPKENRNKNEEEDGENQE
jgi:hypothetical protein